MKYGGNLQNILLSRVAHGLRVTGGMLLFTSLDFAGMRECAVHFDVGNVSIPVVSIDDLIALKTAAGRAIDLSNIAHLQKIKSL